MQPFDDSLYSGYSTYNNWAKVPSSPSSLAKAGFAWGLTGTAASAFNTTTPLTSQTLGYGSTSANPGNAASNYMYSAVVSASSNSPTTSDQDLSKADLQQQYSNMTSKLKAREDDIAARDDENPRDSTPYNNASATTPNALV